VTLRIDAPSVAEAYALSRDDALLFATAEELGRIHKAGLAHGDPYTRNFLATRPRPTPLDVASWSHLRKASQLKDLTRFACSIIKLTADVNQAKAMLSHYERFGQPLPVSMEELIHGAVAYAKVKKIRP
jgi:tRNA A-37 threonylcarbamoyl transferase component Bud32